MGLVGLVGRVEVRLCVQAGWLVLVSAVLARTLDPLPALAVLAAGLALGCVRQPPAHAVLLGVTAWCLLTGFVVHDAAVLTLAGSDLVHLAVLIVAALAGCFGGSRATRSRTVASCPTPAPAPWPSGSSTRRSSTTSTG